MKINISVIFRFFVYPVFRNVEAVPALRPPQPKSTMSSLLVFSQGIFYNNESSLVVCYTYLIICSLPRYYRLRISTTALIVAYIVLI